jgi:hypothetical protein
LDIFLLFDKCNITILGINCFLIYICTDMNEYEQKLE